MRRPPPHVTALASSRCCGGPSAMQHIGCDHACSEEARTTPQTSPLALVGPQIRTAISEFPVSEFPLSRFTMTMMRFHTKWSRFNQPGEIPVSSFHDQGPVPSQFQLSPPQRMFAEASTMLARLSFRRSQPEASKPFRFQPVPVARANFQKRLARHSFPAPQEPISSWQCLVGPSCRKCRRISVPKIPGGCVALVSRSFRQPLSGPS